MIPKYAPKQIVEYIPCDNPEHEKYFVYEWYNITKDKYYVGYHKTEDGTPFDGSQAVTQTISIGQKVLNS